MRTAIFLIIIGVFLVNTAGAFDGKRTGLVVGGGVGLMYNADWSLECYGSGGSGRGYQIIAGYGVHPQNIIACEWNFTACKSDCILDRVSQGFQGVSWYHYFGSGRRLFVTAVGLGGYYFDSDGIDTQRSGPSMMIGLIYQHSYHVQIGVYRCEGKVFSGGRKENKHFTLMLSIFAY